MSARTDQPEGLDVSDVADAVEDIAEAAGDSRALELAVRTGYAVNGLLHLLLAWICVELALLHVQGDADQSGALATLAGQPMGHGALWVGAVAFAGLALWQLTEVIVAGVYGDDWTSRVKDGAKAVVYVVLAWSCLGFARGAGQSGKHQVRHLTSELMGGFGGRLVVALIGVAIISVGCYHVIKGVKQRFLRDLEEHPGDLAVRAGMIGYPTRGAAIGVVGGLFVMAAARDSTAEADGLDAALRLVLDQPYGRVLMALMAFGFAAFGVYLFFRARHARV